jgi:serine/threonine-protein kinase
MRLYLLGGIDLRGADGRELRTVLAQPKRLALLAYLAAHTGSSPLRRDTLLATFWPDLDQHHARNALSKAVHFLRRSLGEGALTSRTSEELALDESGIWSDVSAFTTALAEDRPADALELYRGDLLPGFFVAGAPGFEEWLERERPRLRLCAADAARQLAEQCEAQLDFTLAARSARRAVELSPTDEHAIRSLIRILDRAGDRAGAIHAYEEFARRLAAEYDVEPAAETSALIAAVREESGHAAPTAGAGSARLAAPQVLPRRRGTRLATAVVAVAVVLALAIAGVLAGPGSPGAHPTSSSTTVAVLPFVVRGSGELAYLGEGMVDLLSVNLDDAPALRSVDSRTLLRLVQRRGSAPLDPERGRPIARELGAAWYVLGSVVELGHRVRITASLYPVDPRGGDTVHADVAGDMEKLPELVDELTTELLVGRLPGNVRWATLTSGTTTSSLNALKAYLNGERRWRARESGAAVAAFRRAVEQDTGFALAYYRLAVAASWSPTEDPGDAMERAMRHRARLPERERRLLEAFAARRRGAGAHAESLYVSILRSYPDDAEAWFQLGALRIRHALPWGRPIHEVVEPFERALALDSTHPRASGPLSWLYGHMGRHEEAAVQLRRVLQIDQGEARPLARTALAFWSGNTAAQDKALSELRSIDDTRRIVFAPDFVAQRIGSLKGGVQVARLMTEPSRPATWRARGYRIVAELELARGRHREAGEAIAQAERLVAAYGLRSRALMILTPFLEVSQVELASLRSAIAGQIAESTRDSTWQHYLLGLLSARLEDSVAALHHAAQLESRSSALGGKGSAEASAMARDLALTVRADVVWRSGHLSEAIALLDQGRPIRWRTPPADVAVPEPVDPVSPILTLSYERWAHAELLAGLGQTRQAINWYAGLGMESGEDMGYLAPSRLRIAQMYERLGERGQAVENYARFVELWKNCDPELQWLVEDARRRLARLTGARTP